MISWEMGDGRREKAPTTHLHLYLINCFSAFYNRILYSIRRLMKAILFCVSLLMTCVLCSQVTKPDTIIVRADDICSTFMPERMTYCVADKSGTGYSYQDSIRVCGNIIYGFQRQYYLTVYDQYGVKRLEGYFFDCYANGHCVNYDAKGNKLSEGNYKMVGSGKNKRSKRKGKWIYYDPKGNIRR
jgi:hypothetical protein